MEYRESDQLEIVWRIIPEYDVCLAINMVNEGEDIVTDEA